MTITEFLLARIDEDEDVARGAVSTQGDEGWELQSPEDAARSGMRSLALIPHVGVIHEQVQGKHVERWDPWRVLAECAAKRTIVELYDIQRSRRAAYRSPRSREIEDEQATLDRRMQEARTRPIEDAVRHLAVVYADHPDYRQEWKP